ncbi:MAG: ferritin-like domain-containing protein [Kofleriaceae bacterium]
MDSTTWWAQTKRNPDALTRWLYDQYRGEVTASHRIEAMRDAFCEPSTRAHRVLSAIAKQERLHASWVGALLVARDLPVEVEAKPDRYWREVVPEVTDLETGAAVGAHAERMRLERIEAIAGDAEAPADIRAVFARILPQEQFHARAFASLATDESLARTANAHALGRLALGLEP